MSDTEQTERHPFAPTAIAILGKTQQMLELLREIVCAAGQVFRAARAGAVPVRFSRGVFVDAMTTKLYFADFAMTRPAKVGDHVSVSVRKSFDKSFDRIEVCSFDLDADLPLLVCDRDGEPLLSLPRDVEYRRITVTLDKALLGRMRDRERFVAETLDGMRRELGLPL